MAANDDYILEILQETGLVTKSQLEHARTDLRNGETVSDVLIRQGVLTAEDQMRALAAHAAMEFVDLNHLSIPEDVIQQLPREVARRFKIVPISNSEAGLLIAVGDPLNFDTFDSVAHVLQREVEWVCSTPEQIHTALRKYYGTADEAADELEGMLGEHIAIGEGDVNAAEGDTADAPIIKMVTMMLVEAYNMRASDIHLEPLEKRFRVRFRVDGVLLEMTNPPKKLQSAIISRLKIMTGSMSIAEKRLPQDGRIQVKLGKRSIDLRVSTIPTSHGESVVMRILDKSSLSLGLPQLGFLSDDQEIFERLITLPDGILLVTGPDRFGQDHDALRLS